MDVDVLKSLEDTKALLKNLEELHSKLTSPDTLSEFRAASALNVEEAIKFLKDDVAAMPKPQKRPVGRPRKVLQEVG